MAVGHAPQPLATVAAEVPRVDEEAVALGRELEEVVTLEGHVVGPPEHDGQVVDEQRRDGAGEVLGELAADLDEDLLGADLARAALGQLARRVDVGVEPATARPGRWGRG